MNKLCATFLSGAAAVLLAAPERISPPESNAAGNLRVAFWNIQWFPGRRPHAGRHEEQNQIAAVQRDMRGIAPDIIGMEEVRDFANATLAVAPRSDLKVDVISSFPPREGQDVGQQVAIASRFTPISAWVEMWKRNGALLPPRGFAFAAYEIRPRHLLLVYALHLKSNRGEIAEDIAIREEAMRQLTQHMLAMNVAYAKLGALSWIIGGDFNTTPDDPRFAGEETIRMLRENDFSWCWQNIPFAHRISLPADKFYPAANFDHIFFRNARLISARVIMTSPQSSDHRAIMADLSF
jgi:endonuclease/exonuclease/phosphatase family metal-dependent hydrolase